MSCFWRSLCLLLLGLALTAGQPLRALASLPSSTGGAPMALGAETMPCHESTAVVADAAKAAEPAPCPHCSHGQTGWGCGHCAGCLLGAALVLQAPLATPLIEPGHGDWRALAETPARPWPGRVPTPPPKR